MQNGVGILGLDTLPVMDGAYHTTLTRVTSSVSSAGNLVAGFVVYDNDGPNNSRRWLLRFQVVGYPASCRAGFESLRASPTTLRCCVAQVWSGSTTAAAIMQASTVSYTYPTSFRATTSSLASLNALSASLPIEMWLVREGSGSTGSWRFGWQHAGQPYILWGSSVFFDADLVVTDVNPSRMRVGLVTEARTTSYTHTAAFSQFEGV